MHCKERLKWSLCKHLRLFLWGRPFRSRKSLPWYAIHTTLGFPSPTYIIIIQVRIIFSAVLTELVHLTELGVNAFPLLHALRKEDILTLPIYALVLTTSNAARHPAGVTMEPALQQMGLLVPALALQLAPLAGATPIPLTSVLVRNTFYM